MLESGSVHRFRGQVDCFSRPVMRDGKKMWESAVRAFGSCKGGKGVVTVAVTSATSAAADRLYSTAYCCCYCYHHHYFFHLLSPAAGVFASAKPTAFARICHCPPSAITVIHDRESRWGGSGTYVRLMARLRNYGRLGSV